MAKSFDFLASKYISAVLVHFFTVSGVHDLLCPSRKGIPDTNFETAYLEDFIVERTIFHWSSI